jgi:dual specificity protein phosphatase 1B
MQVLYPKMNKIHICLIILACISLIFFAYPRPTVTQPTVKPTVKPTVRPATHIEIPQHAISSPSTPSLNPKNGCQPYPHLYIGNAEFAANKDLLTSLGITHIINAAQEIPDYHKGDNRFQYMHLKMDDIPQENSSRFFDVSKKFIDGALQGGGNVLIHCAMGISRSVTILMYYLMTTLGIQADEALAMVRRCRPIANPNPGFMNQLNGLGKAAQAGQAA